MRVLVVDDEPRYRAYLSESLRGTGHRVAVAGSGRRAVDLGVAFQPDILVTDWMLKNHLHGLNVARTLQAVNPRIATILITGFACEDLKESAREAGVFRFLEKPFDLKELVSSVELAATLPKPRGRRAPFGVAVVSDSGFVVHANDAAQRMFEPAQALGQPGTLRDVFGPGELAQLETAREHWRLVAPHTPRRARWWARWKPSSRGRVLVLFPERQKYLRSDPRVRMLLGLERPKAVASLPVDKVLVVDRDAVGEVSYVEQSERIGCVCYKAATPALAVRIFRADPGIGVVVIDYQMPGLQLVSLVEDLRLLRPDVEIVGVSPALRHEIDFAAVGVERFLHKPWRIGDLLHALEA